MFYVDSISNISNQFKAARIYTLISLCLAILLSLFISRTIRRNILKPISLLIEKVKKYKNESSNYELYNYTKRKSSMQISIINYLIISVMIPSIICCMLMNIYFAKLIEKKVIEIYRTTFNHTVDNLKDFINKKEKMLRNIIYNFEIQDMLFNTSRENKEDFLENHPELVEVIKTYLLLNGNRDEVYIYKNNRELLVTNTLDTEYDFFRETLKERLDRETKRPLWLRINLDIYNRQMISLFSDIKLLKSDNTRYWFQPIGYIMILINESDIENIYQGLIDNRSFISITDNDNIVISSTIKDAIGDIARSMETEEVISSVNDYKYICLSTHITKPDWTITGYFDYNNVAKEKIRIFLNGALILVLLLLIVIFISYRLSLALIESLGKLSFSMNNLLKFYNKDKKDYQKDYHEIPCSNKTEVMDRNFINEVDELGRAFNEMVIRMEKLINDVFISEIKSREIEAQKKEAQLNLLQAQINPHFLYNTLDSIKWLIKLKDNKNAIDIVTSLGSLLRKGVNVGENFTTVNEEIEHVKAYLRIQKIRYDDKFDVKWDVEEKIMHVKILRFILQPIVENAIHHGLELKEGTGYIMIRGYCNRNKIFFEIEDDGVGMNRDKLYQVDSILHGNQRHHPSVGLKNVNDRIKLNFGDEYGVSIISEEGKGTVVRISLPLINDISDKENLHVQNNDCR